MEFMLECSQDIAGEEVENNNEDEINFPEFTSLLILEYCFAYIIISRFL